MLFHFSTGVTVKTRQLDRNTRTFNITLNDNDKEIKICGMLPFDSPLIVHLPFFTPHVKSNNDTHIIICIYIFDCNAKQCTSLIFLHMTQ